MIKIYNLQHRILKYLFVICFSQAELILECLEISNQYETELSKAVSADKAPPLPLLMQAYNCTNTEDFLLETFKRVRAR